MAIVTEDGSGLSTAESYIDVAYADAYFNKRNAKTEWDAVTEKEKCIIDATDYFETNFTFKGTKYKETQSLEFPRYINYEVVYPTRVKSAICELALRCSRNVLLEDTSKSVLSEKIGEMEVHYNPNSRDEVSYNQVFNLIMPYLNNSGFSSSIVRTY